MSPEPTEYLTDCIIRQITLTTQIVIRYGLQEDFIIDLSADERELLDAKLQEFTEEVNRLFYQRLK